jgi:hypothetical protein
MKTIESDEMPDSTPIHRSCSVVLSPVGGWDVGVEDDPHVVSITHCTEWHRVERCTMQRATARESIPP